METKNKKNKENKENKKSKKYVEEIKDDRKVLVTSALPYVNNVPHLGTMVCVISTDVYTRFLRMTGHDVVSVLGTDEHGTTTESIAMQMNMTPKQVTDHFFSIHKEIYDWFECDFDCFGRTSSKENIDITQEIFMKLFKNGYIYENEEEQMFDEQAQKFLPDRFIEGKCPFCAYNDARGDQCDKCGKLITPSELIDPKSKITGTKPTLKKTKHFYIALDKIQPKLEKFAEERKQKWSDNAYTTTQAWFREGLKPRAITRDLEWGIPVPVKGYEKKVFYVWFDAPIGYIAITKESRIDWKDLWHNPENVRLVQFMGKDNIPFHTVLFPASLIGTHENYTLLDTISVNEYLNYEDEKFSKSRGVGVFGDDAKNTGIPADVWRYYVIINRPERTDTKFTWKDLQEKINNELVGNLGNLVNRTLTFIKRFQDGKIGKITEHLDYSAEINEVISSYRAIELKKALKAVMTLSKKGNQYFQDQMPWESIKSDRSKAENTTAVLANMIKDLSVLMWPVMPRVAEQIRSQLGLPLKFNFHEFDTLLENHSIGAPNALFEKLEDEKMLELQQRYSGRKEVKVSEGTDSKQDISTNDVASILDLRIARIISVQRHPDAEKLYIEKLDLGNGNERTIVSGLVPYYSPDELEGKNIVLVYNLKPAKIRGIMSEGMLLAAGNGKEVGVLHSPDSKPGDKVIISRISNGKNVKEKESHENKNGNREYRELSIDEFFAFNIISDGTRIAIEGNEISAPGKIFVDKGIKGKIK